MALPTEATDQGQQGTAAASPIIVAALYQFVHLPDYRALREPLLEECLAAGTLGTLLLAEEGINGTIAGHPTAIERVLGYLRSDPRLSDIEHKTSAHDEMPFLRMKVKLKREIVTMGEPDIDPNLQVGQYVTPADWNRLIEDPEVLLIDTRNDYEVAIGSFKGAVDPETTNFREFPDFVRRNVDPARHKKVAMFCTGGIRCEKASAFMLREGFEEVFHLQGGILKYLEEVPAEESLWQGECFVFDNRVAVDQRLQRGSYDQCYGCRHPITEADKASPLYAKGVSCPHCHDSLSQEQRARFSERHRQVELAAARNEQHIGSAAPSSKAGQINPANPEGT